MDSEETYLVTDHVHMLFSEWSIDWRASIWVSSLCNYGKYIVANEIGTVLFGNRYIYWTVATEIQAYQNHAQKGQ